MAFLKPTKGIWMILAVLLIVINILLPAVRIISWGEPFDLFDFLVLAFFWIWLPHLAWLWAFAEDIGIDVVSGGGSELFGEPNGLGWTLVILGTSITFMLYYLVARAVSRRIYKQRREGDRVA